MHARAISIDTNEMLNYLILNPKLTIPDDRESFFYFAKGVGLIRITHESLSQPLTRSTLELKDYQLEVSEPH